MGCSPPLVVSLVRDWDNLHLVLGPHLPPEIKRVHRVLAWRPRNRD